MTAPWPYIVVWSLAIGSALPWAYALTRAAQPAAAKPPAASPSVAIAADLTRLLGADPPPAPVASEAPPVADARMQLVGVVSPSSQDDAEEGLALIAINGQPAKVYRVGMAVDGETVLQAVEPRGARLGPRGGATLIALSTAAVDAVATAERQLPATSNGAPNFAPMPATVPLRAAPPSVPPPMPAPVPSADGTPPPFGGPPQAFGGAPPAQPQGLARRSATR